MKSFMKTYREAIIWMIFLCLMVGAAELFGEKEIIFPEAAALALGMWVRPKKPWNITKPMMIVVMTLSAVGGVVIVRYVGTTLAVKCAVGIVYTCTILAVSGTSLVPLISACILPIFLKTSSFMYPVCVMVLVAIIVGVQVVLERMGLREKDTEFVKADFKQRSIQWVKVMIMLEIVCLPATALNKVYLAAPPIIVMAAELFLPGSKLRESSLKAWVVMVMSALIGTCFRMFSIVWGVPLVVCTIVAVICEFIWLKKAELMLPPAAAACVLAMLIKSEGIWQYPVLLGLGSAFMIVVIHMAYGTLKLKNA